MFLWEVTWADGGAPGTGGQEALLDLPVWHGADVAVHAGQVALPTGQVAAQEDVLQGSRAARPGSLNIVAARRHNEESTFATAEFVPPPPPPDAPPDAAPAASLGHTSVNTAGRDCVQMPREHFENGDFKDSLLPWPGA